MLRLKETESSEKINLMTKFVPGSLNLESLFELLKMLIVKLV